MISPALKSAISGNIGSRLLELKAVSGGDINDAFYARTQAGEVFVKVQTGPDGISMFEGERSGLLEMSVCGAVNVPGVLGCGRADDGSAYLILTWHNELRPAASDWQQLGDQLAAMHRCTDSTFGFPENNFIGSLPQDNAQTRDWPEFFAASRIEPLLKKAERELEERDLDNWLRIRQKLTTIIPCDHPALLHGDLWGGNVMHTSRGPLFYDPAVYYGDRLVDIAMTRLFGGFPKGFYDAYSSSFPSSKQELERLELYQLYYLLVHLVLFGRSYLGAVQRILGKYA